MMNPFKKLVACIKYNEAVRKADEAHAKTGERYFVVATPAKKLIIFDRGNFRIMKKKHYIGANKRISDVKRMAIYYTPTFGENEALTDEQIAFRKDAWYRAYCF